MKLKSLFALVALSMLGLVGCKKPVPAPVPEPEPQGSVISFSEMVDLYALNDIEVVIPDYVSEFEEAKAEHRDGYSDNVFFIVGSSSEEFALYPDVLTEAGWTLEVDSYGDYRGTFGETAAEIYYADYINYSFAAIVVQFTIADPVVFPAEEIAEDLASVGVTDTLPAYSGEVSGYNYYSGESGRQLYFTVEDEEVAISTYQADLVAAGYTEAGADSYGDMHYTSPNAQIDVVAWRGSDIGYTGYIFVDITVL